MMMLILNGVESGQHLWDERCMPSTLGHFHKKTECITQRSLNWTRQRSWSRLGVTCSLDPSSKTRRAAAFCTRCSGATLNLTTASAAPVRLAFQLNFTSFCQNLPKLFLKLLILLYTFYNRVRKAVPYLNNSIREEIFKDLF